MGCKISKTTNSGSISQTHIQNSNLDPIQPSLTTYEIQDYFDCSLLTMDFCNSLQSCLKRVRNSQLMIHAALNVVESERSSGGKNYELTLQELRNFSAAGDPFDDGFLSLLQSLPMKQRSMLQKLERKRLVLDAKLNSFRRKYHNEFKAQREIVIGMEMGTRLVIRDLEGIRIHVDRLKIKIESLLQKADFASREEDEAVMVVVDEMKKMIDGFMQAIDDLSKCADQTNNDITMARSVISRKIILQPSDH